MQNGVTAADVAEASGHKDLSKELMAHSLSPQDVGHNEDDVSYSISISIGIDYTVLVCKDLPPYVEDQT